MSPVKYVRCRYAAYFDFSVYIAGWSSNGLAILQSIIEEKRPVLALLVRMLYTFIHGSIM